MFTEGFLQLFMEGVGVICFAVSAATQKSFLVLFRSCSCKVFFKLVNISEYFSNPNLLKWDKFEFYWGGVVTTHQLVIVVGLPTTFRGYQQLFIGGLTTFLWGDRGRSYIAKSISSWSWSFAGTWDLPVQSPAHCVLNYYQGFFTLLLLRT